MLADGDGDDDYYDGGGDADEDVITFNKSIVFHHWLARCRRAPSGFGCGQCWGSARRSQWMRVCCERTASVCLIFDQLSLSLLQLFAHTHDRKQQLCSSSCRCCCSKQISCSALRLTARCQLTNYSVAHNALSLLCCQQIATTPKPPGELISSHDELSSGHRDHERGLLPNSSD